MAACDAYMAKPLRYRELYRLIDALLPAREATLVSLRPSGTAASSHIPFAQAAR